MTDYLTRLLERERAGGLRPRPPVRLAKGLPGEKTPGASPHAPAGPTGGGAPPPPPLAERALGQADGGPAAPARPRGSARAATPRARDGGPIGALPGPEAAFEERPPAATRAQQHAPAAPPPPAPSPAAPRPAASVAARATAMTAHAAPDEPDADRARTPAARAQRRQRAAFSVPDETEPLRPPAGPRRPAVTSARSNGGLRPVVTSARSNGGLRPVAAPLAARSTAPAPAGPAPVHVSIGRIEIRAAPPAPAAERRPGAAPPRGPALALDDYLRSREARP